MSSVRNRLYPPVSPSQLYEAEEEQNQWEESDNNVNIICHDSIQCLQAGSGRAHWDKHWANIQGDSIIMAVSYGKKHMFAWGREGHCLLVTMLPSL